MGEYADERVDRLSDPEMGMRRRGRPAFRPEPMAGPSMEAEVAAAMTSLNRDLNWKTRDGVWMTPSQMGDRHRRNVRAMLVRKIEDNLREAGLGDLDAVKILSLTLFGAELDRLSP